MRLRQVSSRPSTGTYLALRERLPPRLCGATQVSLLRMESIASGILTTGPDTPSTVRHFANEDRDRHGTPRTFDFGGGRPPNGGRQMHQNCGWTLCGICGGRAIPTPRMEHRRCFRGVSKRQGLSTRGRKCPREGSPLEVFLRIRLVCCPERVGVPPEKYHCPDDEHRPADAISVQPGVEAKIYLDELLCQIDPEDRDLVVRYHLGGSAGIEPRSLSIPIGTLRVQVHRICRKLARLADRKVED